jgi:hypothetical protein
MCWSLAVTLVLAEVDSGFFLTSAIDEDKWSAFRWGHINPSPGTERVVALVGRSAGLDAVS